MKEEGEVLAFWRLAQAGDWGLESGRSGSALRRLY